jgi:hypothetical protein
MICDGFVSVPADGLYNVSLRSRDESELKVDGEKAVVNESIDYIGRRAALALKAGFHRVELRWATRGYMTGLELKMDAPGKPLEPVPADRLFHEGEKPGGKP